MSLTPGYGETPVEPEDLDALTTAARAELGDQPSKAELYATQAHEFAGARCPLSAVLLAKLAVDLRYQNRGLGALTLGHALRLLYEYSHDVAFEVVAVHAIDERAAAFYRRHGFVDMTHDGRLLYLTTRALVASMADAQESAG